MLIADWLIFTRFCVVLKIAANRGTAAYKGSRMVKKQQPTPTGDRFEELAQTAQEEKKQHAKEAKKASVSNLAYTILEMKHLVN